MKKILTFALALTITIGSYFSNTCFAGTPVTDTSSSIKSSKSISSRKSSKSTNVGQKGFLLFLSPTINTAVIENMATTNSTNNKVNNLLVSSINIQCNGTAIEQQLSVDDNIITSLATEIYFAQDEKGNKNIYSCYYYNGKCTTPVKLNENINSKSNETFACQSADKNTLYFTSDRRGGFGGMDIWKSERMENGQWGMAQNLGSKINTSEDEISPVILSDNATLYFSSKGHNSVGGFDVFNSTLSDEGAWSPAESAGARVNSANDETYYFLSADEKSAFYTSSIENDGDYIFEIKF